MDMIRLHAGKARQDGQDIFEGNRTRQDGRSAPGDLDSKTFITQAAKYACVVKVFFVCRLLQRKENNMFTLMAIIMFVLFLKLIGFIFDAGMRIFGWLLGGLGFVFSIILAATVIGFVFDLLPILLVIGIVMMAMKPAR